MTESLPDSDVLEEYQPKMFPRRRISDDIERILADHYSAQVAVEAPQYRTAQQWRLTAQGWVGYIPGTPGFGLRLMPKVEIGNLFRMLEYAYRLPAPAGATTGSTRTITPCTPCAASSWSRPGRAIGKVTGRYCRFSSTCAESCANDPCTPFFINSAGRTGRNVGLSYRVGRAGDFLRQLLRGILHVQQDGTLAHLRPGHGDAI